MIGSNPIFSPSEFVAVFNQTLETAYPTVTITGELANFRISKNRWVYFDIKDEIASVKFFGGLTALPGPLQDGLNLEILGQPRLHPQFGFSINILSIRVIGEGSIAKAQALLVKKLESEGLFDHSRKRQIPHPPKSIGLITSLESAAYADFIKVVNARWGKMEINVADILVQGSSAPSQIVGAINTINSLSSPPEAIVMIRGGGSADDLAAFSHELVVRAVATSRLPILVAVGHETDQSLAEMAADMRASTPSNAAELIVPDRRNEKQLIDRCAREMAAQIIHLFENQNRYIEDFRQKSYDLLHKVFVQNTHDLEQKKLLLRSFDPVSPLRRGYALVRTLDGEIVKSVAKARKSRELSINLADGKVAVRVINNER